MIQEHSSSHCGNTGTELIIDYCTDFITYEIFQTRETLIKWARKIDKSHDFMIVIKKFDAPRNEKKRRTLLSCERSEKYNRKEVKVNGDDIPNQQR